MMRIVPILLLLLLAATPASAQSRFEGWTSAIIAADWRDGRGQPIEASVVVENFGQTDEGGMLRVTRSSGGQIDPLAEQRVVLKPGKNVFTIPHTIDTPAGEL